MPSSQDLFPKYFDPRTIAEVEGLELKARRIVEGLVSGLHRSPFRGTSVEFAEHREYSSGDDLRYLDWKVYAKTDRYYLKSFEDESNLSGFVVLDNSESMAYQSESAPYSKYAYGQLLAACLSYLVVRQQDAVGMMIASDAVHGMASPSNQAVQLRSIIQLLEKFEPSGQTNLALAINDAVSRIRRRSVIVVISDLFDELETIGQMLSQLHTRRHDVAVIQVLDPAEREFPFEQLTMFRGLEQTGDQLGDPRVLKEAYLSELESHLTAVNRACRQRGFDHLVATTDQPLDEVIRRFIHHRRRQRRTSAE